MARITFLLIVLLFFGCKSTKKQASSEPAIIMMEKTACMGTCPTYKFEVFPDKTARYSGEAHVDLIGEYRATLTEAQLSSLENRFAAANYFSFAEVYSAPLTDLPTTYVYYHDGQKSLKVTDYWGAPQELKDLEQSLEDFLMTLDWKKID